MTEHDEKTRVAVTVIHGQRDGDRQFVFHPGDNDVFVRTGSQIIAACRLTISVEVWLGELERMMEYVRGWCCENPAVQVCLCSARTARVMLFFIPRSPGFDFELADQLTDLDMRISRDFHVGSVEVGQIPAAQAGRFLVLEESIKIYGQQPGSPSTMGAQS